MSNQLTSFLQLYKPIPEADQVLISAAFEYKTFPGGRYFGVTPQLINRVRKHVDEQHSDQGVEF